MIFGEIEALVSLMGRARKALTKSKEGNNSALEVVSTRLVRIFEAHGVHRNQIPSVLGSGLTVANCQSDEHLLPKLTERILQDACEILNVRREWIDGVSNQVYPTLDFYKSPKEFKKFIKNLVSQTTGTVSGVLLNPKESKFDDFSLLLLQEEMVAHGNKSFYRYYLCNNWAFHYWKSRAYLTACVSNCWANNVYVHGLTVSRSLVKSLAFGETIFNWRNEGIGGIKGERWYAEDMAYSPDIFLKGVVPEQDNFGIKSGLELWLSLEEQGHMYYGIEDRFAKQRFLDKLKQYA